MASHGVPRSSNTSDRSLETKAKEQKEIRQYQILVDDIHEQVQKENFTPELLQKTAELLKKNPEYYTIWNHRRRIYVNEFKDLQQACKAGTVTEADKNSQILDIIQLDLQFLFPLLLQFPKCYWIWNHRLWLLDQSTSLLPRDKSLSLWQYELGLVGQMLTRDSRNFHGWGYRRTVIDNIQSLTESSMVKSELDYTTKMISANLSNYSAWHNRSKLILRFLKETNASDSERRQMLDDELKLIHKALFDPYDQSLWFYHQNLMCTFDPSAAKQTLAPNLTAEQRLNYIEAEQEFVEELLEDTDDCKWIYQALIELVLLRAKVDGKAADDSRRVAMMSWLDRLKSLDPLRRGRWDDLQQSIESSAQ